MNIYVLTILGNKMERARAQQYELVKETTHYLFVRVLGNTQKIHKTNITWYRTEQELSTAFRQLLNAEITKTEEKLTTLRKIDSLPIDKVEPEWQKPEGPIQL